MNEATSAWNAGRTTEMPYRNSQEERLIRYIDRARKGARRPDEQKHPRVVLAIALNGVRHSETAIPIRPVGFPEDDDRYG